MKSLLPVVFALLTGLFWGTYGPTLAQARFFEKSAFKPYVMIGVAYLVWGIIGGLAGMAYTRKVGEPFFSFTNEGIFWGFAAGSLGAWGALTLTLAMFTGGTAMPQIVMPIVFGTAVSVSAHHRRDHDQGRHSSDAVVWGSQGWRCALSSSPISLLWPRMADRTPPNQPGLMRQCQRRRNNNAW